LEYITTIWYVLWPFGNLLAIWYIFPRFGILCQYKSCNPALGYYIGRGSGQDSDKLLPEHSQFGNKMCNKASARREPNKSSFFQVAINGSIQYTTPIEILKSKGKTFGLKVPHFISQIELCSHSFPWNSVQYIPIVLGRSYL
jgi:hypothetical protein